MMISKNVDRSMKECHQILANIDRYYRYYMAVHLQDTPNNQSTHLLENLADRYKVINCHFNNQGEYDNTSLISPISYAACTDIRFTSIGNNRAAGILTKAQMKYPPPSGHIYMINIYIRPTATFTDVSNLLGQIVTKTNGELSKVLIIGDINASSPLWDPLHDLVEEQADTKQNYHQSKVQRGAVISQFVKRHQMNVLKQLTTEPKPTFIDKNTEGNRKSFIDVAIAGNKIERHCPGIWVLNLDPTGIWPQKSDKETIRTYERRHTNEHANQHQYLLVGTKKETTIQRNKRKIKQVTKPNLIVMDNFIPLKYKIAGLIKNWRQTNDRETIIKKLEFITDLTMTHIELAQDRATMCKSTHSKRKGHSIEGIIKQLRKNTKEIKELKLKKRGLLKTSNPRVIWYKEQIGRKTKNKLLRQLQNMVKRHPENLWTKVNPVKQAYDRVTGNNETQQTIRDQQELNELAEKLFPKIEGSIGIES